MTSAYNASFETITRSASQAVFGGVRAAPKLESWEQCWGLQSPRQALQVPTDTLGSPESRGCSGYAIWWAWSWP